jgi:hypothetical protein
MESLAVAKEALRKAYDSDDMVECAIAHIILSVALESAGDDYRAVIAHRIAAALICLRADSHLLHDMLRSLARAFIGRDLRRLCPTFSELCAAVQRTGEVSFRDLCDRMAALPINDDDLVQGVFGNAIRYI